MEEIAYAKINLALHIRAREPDGYHRLETIFAFAEDGDRLSVAPSDRLHLRVTGPFGEALSGESDNLVLRAAEALREAAGVGAGAALLLDKRLPLASGIGGGSADAAATLRLLDRFWETGMGEEPLLELASRLGADVPACLRSETVRGEGRGDRLMPVDGGGLAGVPLLLVNPGVQVSTALAFARWDSIDRGPLGQHLSLEEALRGRNDLEQAARSLAPEIGDVLALLQNRPGTRLARMSGSGATCFAMFHTAHQRDRADAAIAALKPAWWRLSTRIR